ncbi:MAG: glycoside hydrolase family 2, partial [Lachnospiraceae bacterium]|nr:glycoside hydrolase family 2 [Lachnospiraceae bacterium]
MNGKFLWNDGWLFLVTPVGTSYEKAAERRSEFAAVDIPHDWLIHDALHLYEDGTGWYRKSFVFEQEEKKAFITFEGVYMDSTVYINGRKAGEWKYGYSTFTLDITEFLKQGENEIFVSVCFQSPNSRWYSGAGIYRDVWFKITDKTYLPENAVYVSTKKQDGGSFLLHLEGEAEGERREDAVLSYSLFDDMGKEVELKSPDAGDCKIGRVREYLIENVKLWDVENPVLYTLRTDLLLDGEIIWQEEEKIGFRYTEFHTDKGFFLNGR